MTITASTVATERSTAASQRFEASVGGLPYIEDATTVAPRDARELSRLFFDRLAELEEGTHAYQYARNTLIEINLSLVRFAASRFRSRGDQMEDIIQVGTIGLIKAIDRFDLSREVEFTTFAVPYIVGEIKRHFRDTSWSVHVPRRLQELRVELAKATGELSQELDHSPTPDELAAHLGLSREEVVEGIVASNGYTAGSIDVPVDEGSDQVGNSFADRLGDVDPALEGVENLQALKPLVAELDDRDRQILRMRFGGEMTQSEIGAELGISQMHVSRLLTRILGRLRVGLLGAR
ncbi:RNA polymerase sigma factor SigF [Streptomyces sp. HU2014]|uniref:RNA polymerase sigma factor n=1 Tax=Streptomyces albireticuli TaxID=1940 RepID=A0A1Z2L0Z0_9ACTN|nr:MULTISPECIES: RNA polymerase sigma factor SigF [Streptomyces]ARZ67926.1 RNA polymerase sigma factor [Streptomyces albireticuli]UQI47938.1 RNA polymerase sigma factor SigF [Streptomyces sp. HU2014]